MQSDYAQFIRQKADSAHGSRLDVADSGDMLYPFQRALVEWASGLGRGAIWADCGLGKTPMQLVWADTVSRATDKPVLVLTPLAVGPQTLREAEKFNVDAVALAKWPAEAGRVVVANYERLHHIDDVTKFGGIVCDESSILKSFDGVRRTEITAAMRQVPYRLLCTATAAPNDYTELGTSSEALGYLGHMDMLNRFFVNDQNSSHPNRLIAGAAWRFRGHAQQPFWRWVSSWARACRKPSDLGFYDTGFDLPPLIEESHVVQSSTLLPGELFARPAMDLREERVERKQTLQARCEKAAELVQHDQSFVIWCHLNAEGDLLRKLIPDAVEVSGAIDDDEKERRFTAFQNGTARGLIIKPKIGAWGLNWQHCAHVVTFGGHSYEQYYQCVRRCWRFGQTRPVKVDVVISEGESRVMESLRRKSKAADAMFASLVAHMRDAQDMSVSRHNYSTEVPSWLATTRQ